MINNKSDFTKRASEFDFGVNFSTKSDLFYHRISIIIY